MWTGTTNRLNFNPETVPWLDRCYGEIDDYVSKLLDDEQPVYDLREKLVRWLRDGYVAFPALVEPDLIDAYLADIDHVLRERATSGVFFNIEGFGEHRAREYPPEAWEQRHFRVRDLHSASTAGKALALHPGIVGFLRHIFRQTPVLMQTLTFIYGSEQSTHQDFPFVTAEIPSHLAAAWIALEDVDPAAGPLFYYPGSHTVAKFDWGNGLTLTSESSRTAPEFTEHLNDQVAAGELAPQVFWAKKGDVFFWHSALVHGGSPTEDPARTRRSLVAHYSTASAFSRDRRAPDEVPLTYSINGGFVFADPSNPEDEDRYQSWPLPPGTAVERLDLRAGRSDVNERSRAGEASKVPVARATVRDLATRALRKAKGNRSV